MLSTRRKPVLGVFPRCLPPFLRLAWPVTGPWFWSLSIDRNDGSDVTVTSGISPMATLARRVACCLRISGVAVARPRAGDAPPPPILVDAVPPPAPPPHCSLSLWRELKDGSDAITTLARRVSGALNRRAAAAAAACRGKRRREHGGLHGAARHACDAARSDE